MRLAAVVIVCAVAMTMTVSSLHIPHKLLDSEERHDAKQHPQSNSQVVIIVMRVTMTTV